MSKSKINAAWVLLCGVVLFISAPLPALAYGIDGMFGGRPNPDGTVTLDVPIQTDLAPDRAQSVLDHPRTDYDPVPLRAGSFLITPALEAGIAYNSNIYDTPQAVADEVYAVAPRVTATSDWGRNFLSFTAAGDFDFFQNNPSQNLNNSLVQADGRYDLMNQTWLAGRAGYQMQAVPRQALDNGAGSAPTTFNLYTAGASAYRGAGIVRAQADYTFNHFDYSDSGGNNPPLNTYNRNENDFGGKVFYVVTEDFKPYLNAQFNTRTYDTASSRNSQGYRADLGTQWDFGGITSIDIYTGWLGQNYSSYGAQPLNQGADFGGKLTWNVTGLTTVVLDANRSIEEAIIAGYNSYMASGGSATVTHELRRNILLETDLSYSADAYRGLSQRQDDITAAGGGARYLINRNLYTDVDYSWNHRSSLVEAQGYVDHLVIAKLGMQF